MKGARSNVHICIREREEEGEEEGEKKEKTGKLSLASTCDLPANFLLNTQILTSDEAKEKCKAAKETIRPLKAPTFLLNVRLNSKRPSSRIDSLPLLS